MTFRDPDEGLTMEEMGRIISSAKSSEEIWERVRAAMLEKAMARLEAEGHFSRDDLTIIRHFAKERGAATRREIFDAVWMNNFFNRPAARLFRWLTGRREEGDLLKSYQKFLKWKAKQR